MANILVSGAARGIGFALARRYAAAGNRVFAMARDPVTAGDLVAEAARSGGRITVHAMDVRDDASVRAAIAGLEEAPIDVLLNVAGVLGHIEPELEPGASDWAQWHDVFEVMTFGPLRVLQAALPLMATGSKVMNLTTQLSASTWPYGGFYPYVASKAALNRLMRSVAIDLRPRGIVVGLIHPGYVQTELGGPDAEITPDESAEGIRKVAAGWTLEQSGEFLKWTGEPHAW